MVNHIDIKNLFIINYFPVDFILFGEILNFFKYYWLVAEMLL